MRTDRIVASPTQERPDDREVPGMSRTRLVLFGTTLVAYAATVVAVLANTALVRLDWQVMLFRPYKQWPRFHAFLDYFVVLGQRGPTAVLVAAWLGWRTYKQRSLRPLLVLGTSLLLLNITVGAVKYGLGRLGPHYATRVGSAELFMGGDIFPSGHTANAVVTWGVLAYLASTPFARRVGSVISAMLAMGVGMTTIYLGTHWVSDVLSGWCAGLLVLLALPWFEPAVARAEEWLMGLLRRVLPARLTGAVEAPAVVPAAGQGAPEQEPAPACGTVRAGSAPAAAATAARGTATHHSGVRPHAGRYERPTPPPGANRRPHPERPARPATPPVPVVRGRGGPA
ncbi:phosphatase PAP2 family protein [Streptomyces sp. SL13]|uniref:Phosphatase PAP2 family protein n=1 Tax=Streptantibioticus silvisoli TaxID=2705255 RepID=A0AA90H9Y6_9ACTN|nr:phosphatase PAP2 family protein [Streptantibioticus silvisoli]